MTNTRTNGILGALLSIALVFAAMPKTWGDSRSPEGLTGLQILEKSLQAEKTHNYRGTQTIEVRTAHGDVTYKVFVAHEAPDTEYRRYLAPEGVKGHRVRQTGQEHIQYLPGKTPQVVRFGSAVSAQKLGQDMLDLIRRNYRVSFQRMGRIAGRRVFVVNLSPKWVFNGDPSLTTYVDKETYVVLAMEQFGPNVSDPGRLPDEARPLLRVSVERFDTVEFPKKITDADMEIPSGPDVKETTVQDVVRVATIGEFGKHLKGFVPRIPLALPPGYAMEHAIAMPKHPSGSGGQIFFTNGVGVAIMGFVRPGDEEQREALVKASSAPPGNVQPLLGSLKMCRKVVGDTLYTLVANLDDDSIKRLCDSIDPRAERSIIVRICASTGGDRNDVIRLRQEGLGIQQAFYIMRISADGRVPPDEVYRTYRKTVDLDELFRRFDVDFKKALEEQQRIIDSRYLFTVHTEEDGDR